MRKESGTNMSDFEYKAWDKHIAGMTHDQVLTTLNIFIISLFFSRVHPTDQVTAL